MSTCLRTEVYAVASRFHGAMSDIRNFFSAWSGIPPEEFSDHLYSLLRRGGRRPPVQGGCRPRLGGARRERDPGPGRRRLGSGPGRGPVGPVLATLFRQALEVGKRVRSETAIARGTTSLSQAAVARGRRPSWGRLAGKTTLVLGAGEMGEAMAQALAGAMDAGSLLVANRTWSRATQLAARCGGRAIEWSALPAALVQADVLLASTGSPDLLLEAADLEPVLAAEPGRPLLIVDIAVPRDVDPAVGALPGVTLLDMDDLSASPRPAMAGRRQEVPKAEAIVAEEVDRYLDVAAARHVAPLVAALHERGEAIRTAELSPLPAPAGRTRARARPRPWRR